MAAHSGTRNRAEQGEAGLRNLGNTPECNNQEVCWPRGRSDYVLAARTWGTEAVVTCQPGRADWLAAVAFLRPCAASGRAQPATLTPTPLPILPSFPPFTPLMSFPPLLEVPFP